MTWFVYEKGLIYGDQIRSFLIAVHDVYICVLIKLLQCTKKSWKLSKNFTFYHTNPYFQTV